MLNVWWFTRPKRRVTGIPNIIASVVPEIIGQKWTGDRKAHLAVESALEGEGLKRVGDRRDQGGSGGRTYFAWLRSYGFIFEYKGQLEFTLAAEDILNGANPVEIMRSQVLRYQFPSNFSRRKGSEVAPRFRIRPYRFVLRLLKDPRLEGYVTEDEIAFILIGEASDESDRCYRQVVNHIIDYRDRGEAALMPLDEMNRVYRGGVQGEARYYTDIANTMVNVFEYTQIIVRRRTDDGRPCISIAPDMSGFVDQVLAENPRFIENPENEALFQRKYGVGAFHQKDTRNLAGTRTVTARHLMESQIKRSFINLSTARPIFQITDDVVEAVMSANNGTYSFNQVDDVLRRTYPGGAVTGFFSNYYQMAFSGRAEATDFEKATCRLFRDVFGFDARWIAKGGRVPDVILSTDSEGYQAIIDTKAYSSYTISHDHFNRMAHTYIPQIDRYQISRHPLVAFSYIAGGFGKSVETSLDQIHRTTGIPGSAFTVKTVIRLAERALEAPVTHATWRGLLTSGKVLSPDMLD